jgi:ABC-type sugar transport system permease subunit
MAYGRYHTVGFPEKDLSVGYVLPTVILGILVILAWRWMANPAIPTVNSYFGDITLKKAHSEFMLNARGLIKEGVTKVRYIDFPKEWYLICMFQFNGPFRIITTLGSRVILPATYTEWLKGCSDLDHQALVHDVR